MEANTKQQQLTFDKGITNVPSDAICSDNALADSVGMIYDDGEHRVIQRPKEVFTNPDKGTILYVHNLNDQKRYIASYTYEDNTHQIKTVYAYYTVIGDTLYQLGVLGRTSGRVDHFFYQEGAKFTSIGKTLIVSDTDGLHYFLWKDNAYDTLPPLPAPDITFRLRGYYSEDNVGRFKRNTCYANVSIDGMLKTDSQGVFRVIEGKKDAWNNAVIGVYAKVKKVASTKKRFTRPFFVRAAIRLYDDTYTMLTQPVLMLPAMGLHGWGQIREDADHNRLLVMYSYVSALQYQLKNTGDSNYSDYSDIVKNITLFVTDEIETVDTTIDQPDPRVSKAPIGHGIYAFSDTGYPSFQTMSVNDPDTETDEDDTYYDVMTARDTGDIEEDIKSASIFYKLCDIGITPNSDWTDVANHIASSVLENITTQDQLPSDDYYSRSKLTASFLYAYNARLNLAGITRGFFEGYDNFLPYDNNSEATYRFYVTIHTDTKDVTVCQTAQTKQKQGIWFYYPDPRATRVLIVKEGTGVILNAALTEHPGLNGAYYFRGLPTADYIETVVEGAVDYGDDYDNDATENLPNYIIQSEVNNPFTFTAKGYHRVSTGKIIGMSTTTMALSQDQFGKTDLIVFTDTGLWGMQVDRTGAYDSIHPITRDVCINPESITQTDGAVVFVSMKGLMVVSERGVSCLSEQLSGKSEVPFLDYMKNAFIAYDYRDAMLWLFNRSRYCYVYAMRSRTFARYDCGEAVVTNVVNDYPDYLLQAGETVSSLLDRPDINDPTETGYVASMESRPMKLENALALKSIRQIRHIRNMEGTMTLRIFASNNAVNWVELHSLRGKPWKYYRFHYDFTDLRATDRFAGSIIVTQERRIDKLR